MRDFDARSRINDFCIDKLPLISGGT